MNAVRFRSVPRPLTVSVALLTAALLAGLVVQGVSRSARRGDQASPLAETQNPRDNALGDRDLKADGGTSPSVVQGPFGPAGREIPVAAARSLITLCVWCPQLPPEGLMSESNVSTALTAAEGEVLLRYEDGVDLYVNPGSQLDSQEWIEGWTADIAAGGWPGQMIDLRGTRAAAAERHFLWSAVVTWVEGTSLIEIYGKGGQTLDELIQRAESLLSPPAP